MGNIIFESKYRNPIYAHYKERTVKFRNGQTTIRDNDPVLKEMLEDPDYGVEFAKLGELDNPSRFEVVKVTRGASSNAPADSSDRIPAGRPPEPVEAPRRGRPPKVSTT
jgi:hypothetical protein